MRFCFGMREVEMKNLQPDSKGAGVFCVVVLSEIKKYLIMIYML